MEAYPSVAGIGASDVAFLGGTNWSAALAAGWDRVKRWGRHPHGRLWLLAVVLGSAEIIVMQWVDREYAGDGLLDGLLVGLLGAGLGALLMAEGGDAGAAAPSSGWRRIKPWMRHPYGRLVLMAAALSLAEFMIMRWLGHHAWDSLLDGLVVGLLGLGLGFSFMANPLAAALRAADDNAGRLQDLAEEAEKVSALLTQVLDVAVEGYVVLEPVKHEGRVADFRLVRVNGAAGRLLGRAPEALVGRTIKQEFPAMEVGQVYRLARRSLATGARFDTEYYYDGGDRRGWFQVSGARLGEGLVVTFTDVSARKAAEREHRLAAIIFETAGDAMMVSDHNNRIISVNPAFTRITGYTAAEAVGRNPRLLSSGRHDHAFYVDLWRKLRTERVWQGELWNRARDGRLYPQRTAITAVCDEDRQVVNHIAIFNDVTKEREEAEHLRYLANYDALTGLPNRGLLRDRLGLGIAAARRTGAGLAVLFIDLDGFKPVNDNYGHLVGDRLLQAVAERLTATFRESDTVARLGGDEFVVLWVGRGGRNLTEFATAKAAGAFAEPFDLGEGIVVSLGASVGAAVHPHDGEEANALIAAADQAMYAVKHARREGANSSAAPAHFGRPLAGDPAQQRG